MALSLQNWQLLNGLLRFLYYIKVSPISFPKPILKMHRFLEAGA